MGELAKPLLKFCLLGLALWLGNAYLSWQASYRIDGPSAEALAAAYNDWETTNNTPPNAEQKSLIRGTLITDSVLVAEAIRFNLHKTDPVVRQRLLVNAGFLDIGGSDAEKVDTAISLNLHKSDGLIRRVFVQRMKAIGRNSADPLPPINETDLKARYEQSPDRWRIDPQIAFAHIFFSKDGNTDADLSRLINTARTRLASEPLPDNKAISLGNPFMLGNYQPLTTLSEVQNKFGGAFARSITTKIGEGRLPLDQWAGPLASAFGFHLVKVTRFEPATRIPFDNAKAELIDDYRRDAEATALQAYIEHLMNKYEVITP